MGLRFVPLRADLMSAYSLEKFNSLSKLHLHWLEVTCVGYQPVLEWIHIDNYNQRVLKPLVLVKAVGKDRTSTQGVDVLNF